MTHLFTLQFAVNPTAPTPCAADPAAGVTVAVAQHPRRWTTSSGRRIEPQGSWRKVQTPLAAAVKAAMIEQAAWTATGERFLGLRSARRDAAAWTLALVEGSPEAAHLLTLTRLYREVGRTQRAVDRAALHGTSLTIGEDEFDELARRCERISMVRASMLEISPDAAELASIQELLNEGLQGLELRIQQIDAYQQDLWRRHLEITRALNDATQDSDTARRGEGHPDLRDQAIELAAEAEGDRTFTDNAGADQ